MDRVALSFFPLPHLHQGERRPGLRYDWVNRCNSCDRQCERSKSRAVELCSYGVNFVRLDEDLLVAGIVVRDFPGSSAARTKMIRRTSQQPTMEEVRRVIDTYRAIGSEEINELRERKDEILQAYKESEGYREELLEDLRPELKKMLAQIHDYRQFVSQVVQNMNVILERRAPGCEMDEKLGKAAHEEAAIYWAARLMEEKIATALFLLDPERIDSPESETLFRLHGCVLKYVRVYQSAFDQKNVRVSVTGTSYGRVRGNPSAVAVVPHTLLDNALKYSPRGSRVEVAFDETEKTIRLSVASLGPRIQPEEREAIFDLFVRGSEAKKLEPDGTGFGLHLAAIIASKLGSKIEVEQSEDPGDQGLFWTEFSISLPRE